MNQKNLSRACTLFLLILTSGLCSAQVTAPAFDSTRAYALLKKQCEFGPRPVGVPAHEKLKGFLAAELERYTSSVELQNFTHFQHDRQYQLANIIARFGDTSKPGVLLCAHWDTRPTADYDPNPQNRTKPIMGADDGASGVAVLLQLALIFHESPPAVPVTIVLLDGEDFGPDLGNMLLGARYFASQLGSKPSFRYGILLDMIGKNDVSIFREGNSESAAPAVNDKVWKAAAELGYGSSFIDHVKYYISDDHQPIINAGVPCIDLIDFDYPYWHTLMDTADKCSAESLGIVGETLARVVYAEKP